MIDMRVTSTTLFRYEHSVLSLIAVVEELFSFFKALCHRCRCGGSWECWIVCGMNSPINVPMLRVLRRSNWTSFFGMPRPLAGGRSRRKKCQPKIWKQILGRPPEATPVILAQTTWEKDNGFDIIKHKLHLTVFIGYFNVLRKGEKSWLVFFCA